MSRHARQRHRPLDDSECRASVTKENIVNRPKLSEKMTEKLVPDMKKENICQHSRPLPPRGTPEPTMSTKRTDSSCPSRVASKRPPLTVAKGGSTEIPTLHVWATPAGGDVNERVSTDDLDVLCRPALTTKYLPAITLWRFFQHPNSGDHLLPDRILETIKAALACNPWLFAPLLTRGHWMTAIFYPTPGGTISATVLDSAPSAITAKDVERLMRALGVKLSGIVSFGRQPVNTTQCGVHVALFAMLCIIGKAQLLIDARPPADKRTPLEMADLEALRSHLRIAHRCGGLNVENSSAILKTVSVPRLRAIIDQPDAPRHSLISPTVPDRRSGGGPPRKPPGIANPPGEAICFAIAVAQCFGLPNAVDHIVQAMRAKGFNELNRDGVSRQHACPIDALHLDPCPLPLDSDVNTLDVISSTCGCSRVENRLESFVFGGPATAWSSERKPDYCATCRAPHPVVTVLTTIESCGPRLLFAVSRADYDRSEQFVATHRVDVPERLVLNTSAQSCSMELTGLVCWAGGKSTARGHYTAYRLAEGTWYRLDDHVVAQKNPLRDRRLPAAVVMALYEKPSTPPPSPADPLCAPQPRTPTQVAQTNCASTTAAPPSPGPPQVLRSRTPPVPRPFEPLPLTHRRVRDLAAKIRPGQRLDVSWRSGNHHARWLGQICPLQNTRVFNARYYAEFCEQCRLWHKTPEEYTLPLPNPNVTYLHIEVVPCDPPFAEDCGLRPPVEDEGDEASDTNDVAPAAPCSDREARLMLFADDRECLNSAAEVAQNAGARRGNFLSGVYIYPGRPSHKVHNLAWSALSHATRKEHITWLQRVKAMPDDLRSAPLGAAIVELVLRFAKTRKWTWSTISSRISMIASAFRQLDMYTDELQGFELAEDRVFKAAMQRSQHAARVDTGPHQLTKPLTHEQFSALASSIVSTPRTWLLAQLMWHFASRPADMRQIRPSDVQIQSESLASDGFLTTILFRFGKGVVWSGPYSIHVVLPQAVGQRLHEEVRSASPGVPMFTTADQARVGKAVKEVARCTLRSFRRGALVYLAQCGVSDANLQLLSGHKRRETLLRYLGIGALSSSAVTAARARTAAQREHEASKGPRQSPSPLAEASSAPPVGAGMRTEEDMRVLMPPPVGPNSGVFGPKGQRFKPPKWLEPDVSALRLHPVSPAVTKDWPLHVKMNIGLLKLDQLETMARNTPLERFIPQIRAWLNTSVHFNVSWVPLSTMAVPFSNFSPDHVRTLIQGGKIEAHEGDIRAYARGWLLVQASKERLRPIFEPQVNASLSQDEILRVSNQSRLERRAQVLKAKFQCEFDFAAFYDQIPLGEDVRNFFVIRVRDADKKNTLYRLTRLPMGACHAVGIAQYITWLVTLPFARDVSTTIDNVRICASDEASFIKNVRSFLHRVSRLGLTINDADQWSNVSDSVILQRGYQNRIGPFVHLGEEYRGDSICCVQKHTRALQDAMATARERNFTVTRRWFAAFMGLVGWMSHILSISLVRYFSLMRTYSRIMSAATTQFTGVDWDAPYVLSGKTQRDMADAAGPLLSNVPVPIAERLPPGRSNRDYDTIIISDASAAGMGAYVRLSDGTVWLLRKGWRTQHMRFSASAEPWAAREAILWAKSKGPLGNLALVVDHQAIASGQRRWWDAFKGFSAAFPLNALFFELYAESSFPPLRRDVFYVKGELNIADAPSRDVAVGEPFSAAPVSMTFPDVALFDHPYASAPAREPWMM